MKRRGWKICEKIISFQELNDNYVKDEHWIPLIKFDQIFECNPHSNQISHERGTIHFLVEIGRLGSEFFCRLTVKPENWNTARLYARHVMVMISVDQGDVSLSSILQQKTKPFVSDIIFQATLPVRWNHDWGYRRSEYLKTINDSNGVVISDRLFFNKFLYTNPNRHYKNLIFVTSVHVHRNTPQEFMHKMLVEYCGGVNPKNAAKVIKIYPTCMSLVEEYRSMTQNKGKSLLTTHGLPNWLSERIYSKICAKYCMQPPKIV